MTHVSTYKKKREEKKANDSFIVEPYSLLNDMTHGLKMSKLFSKGHYESLQHIQPYWKKAQETPNDADVTLITTTTPESWKDFVNLVENWDGKLLKKIKRRVDN